MDSSEADIPNSQLLLDQADELYKNLDYSNWSVVLISSFLVWILWPIAPLFSLLLWDSLILLLTLVRHFMAVVYWRTPINDGNVKKWIKIYIAGTFLSGVIWGTLLLFIVPTNEVIYLITTIFMLGGLVTGSAASLASLKYGFALFSIPAIIPGAMYLIYLNEPLTFVIGCSMFMFLVFIFFISLSMHKTIFYSLKKQVEIGNMLSAMEIEKGELEQKVILLKEQLEQEKARSEELQTSLKHKNQAGPMARRSNDLLDERFVALLDNLRGGVWDMNIKSGEVIFSNGWLNMLGYGREDVTNHVQFWESILHPEDRLAVLNKLHEFADGKLQEFSSTHRLKTKSGDWIWVMSRAHGVIWGSFGELLHVVGMELYMPESGGAFEKSLDLLNFDINGWFFSTDNFNERLRHLIRTASVDEVEHSLCYIEIVEMTDDFQEDESLSEIYSYEVGRVLLGEYRQGDAIIRPDMNSFILLMEFCKVEDAWEKALELQKSIKNHQVIFKGAKYKITLSIGITPISTGNLDAEEVINDAIKACEMAKSTTSNLIYLYQRDNEELGTNLFEKHIVKKLQDCIDNNSIQISAIPLQTLPAELDGQDNIFSINASLGNDNNGTYAEADFKVIANRNNMAPELDTCVIQNIFQWMANDYIRNAGADDIYIYECSNNSYLNEQFIYFVKQELNRHPQLNSAFCFGISEKNYIRNKEVITDFIEYARGAGCRVALTDFGATFMSNKIIKACPVDFLKIDKSLLQDMEKDKSSYITLKYLNEIIHLAGMKSIVEDSDNEFPPDTLHAMKIDFVQNNGLDSSVQTIK